MVHLAIYTGQIGRNQDLISTIGICFWSGICACLMNVNAGPESRSRDYKALFVLSLLSELPLAVSKTTESSGAGKSPFYTAGSDPAGPSLRRNNHSQCYCSCFEHWQDTQNSAEIACKV